MKKKKKKKNYLIKIYQIMKQMRVIGKNNEIIKEYFKNDLFL